MADENPSQVICFLNYDEFFAYNFPFIDHTPDGVPRPALDIDEATRLILMKLHVTKIVPPGESDGQALPVVHFKGVSKSLHGSCEEDAGTVSDVRGEINISGDSFFPPPFFSLPTHPFPVSLDSLTDMAQVRAVSPPRATFAGPPSPSSTARSAGVARASRSGACARPAASSATGSTRTTTPTGRAARPPTGRLPAPSPRTTGCTSDTAVSSIS